MIMKNKYYVYAYLDPRKPGKYFYEGLDFCFLYDLSKKTQSSLV